MCIGIGIDDFVTSVPNIIAASIAISFVGFFMGPLFATVTFSPSLVISIPER